MLSLVKILIPSWRFFDDTGPIPKLYVRVQQGGQLENSWLPALTPPKRHWYSLFINPEGNFYHAVCNALEHLLQHPENKDANRIIHRYVRHHLIHERGLQRIGTYQFKVTVDEQISLLSSEESL